MTAPNNRNLIAIALLVLCAHQTALAQSSTTNPWRGSDSALLQVCFDKLDGEAPATLPMTVVSETSLTGNRLELVGYTATKQPIYQGDLAHPARFRSALVTLPGARLVVKVDRPANLDTFIDIWKDVPSDVCFSDVSFAFKMLSDGKPISDAACPDLGISLKLKVTSGSEHALVIRDARAAGPAPFNGLRGCREPVYPPRKGT